MSKYNYKTIIITLGKKDKDIEDYLNQFSSPSSHIKDLCRKELNNTAIQTKEDNHKIMSSMSLFD